MAHTVVSFAKIEDFTKGGLVSNVDVEFRNARWEMWDYDGTQPEESLALSIDLHELLPDGSVNPEMLTLQRWSAGGSATNMVPDETGRYVLTESNATFRNSSNFAVFMESLFKEGFTPTDSDAHVFNGLQAHVVRVPVKRDGLPQTGGGTGRREKGSEVLIVEKIIALPGQNKAKGSARGAKAGAASPAGAGAGAAKPSAGGVRPAGTAAQDAHKSDDFVVRLAGVLTDDVDEMPLKAFKVAFINSFQTLKTDAATKTASIGVIRNDEQLVEALENIGFVVDGENITRA